MMLATERQEREVHTDRVRDMASTFGSTHHEMEKITHMLHEVSVGTRLVGVCVCVRASVC